MNIAEITPIENFNLRITSTDGRTGVFDLKPYLGYEVFEPLKKTSEFKWVSNGLYFVEWACGADLSADTIEAKWKICKKEEV